MKLNNKYYLLRHGEAVSNVKKICSSWPEQFENPLTKRGIKMIEESLQKLIDKKVDMIFSSDLLRTKQTAKIVGKQLNLEPKFDTRLREIQFGSFNNRSIEDFEKYFENEEERMRGKTPDGENYIQVLDRVYNFFGEIDALYSGKTILIVSHQAPLLLLYGKVKGCSILESIEKIETVFTEKRIQKGELVELN
ncbi:MAG: hypothetical protein UR31_C0001G0021 [Parcubacteria group bacterium GW2011_GWA2_33_14]|uniref:Phosphoglycerate mutase n=1 Tax=Candidatus Staskawiczbacteria bacterium RIFCSPHIGHO2_02_FULL_33_16 TaxID=1802204 RepID=A0A1G2HU53_9BACT|nr:MAG: hypothetical protein UR31_C0001G0021 [Parcubacteria group bacterium GW2011_GWA2_33_14]OGZ66066.1 MAG: hypothetical protein A3D34_02700 [Candidatus Staskawiczbacteria bacterium RIFCSPHIGHO2_02_FULL_33_16]OGZ70817.1 MAG: hypothetical protein A2980_02190 [Candidatus Staskawiczbacteria bacterium RIFCSPLOWO2_01_FULL_33_13]